MLKKRIFIFILITLPWIAYAQVGAGRDSIVRMNFVQILSSYKYEDNWDTSIAKSLCSKIEYADPQIDFTVRYAGLGGLSSFLTERFAMQGAFSSGRLSVGKVIPRVLVLIGDESWMLYRAMDLRGLWERVPVVLCGVSSEIMSDYSRFFPSRTLADSLMIPLPESLRGLPATGVVLNDRTSKILEMIKHLQPEVSQLVFLTNHSYQDVLAEKQLRKAMLQYPTLQLKTILSDKHNADSIPQLLAHLPSTAAVVVNMITLSDECLLPVFSLRESTSKQDFFVGGTVPPIDEIASYAAQMVIQLCKDTPAASIPFVYVGERPILNKESVIHFGFTSAAKNLPGVIFKNIPPPFFIRHIRTISFLGIVSIVLFFSILIYYRSRDYSRRLKESLETFKQLFGKYQTVYKSMPLGLFSLNKEGDVLQLNEAANAFLEAYPVYAQEGFNLFSSNILNEEEVKQVKHGVSVGFSRWIEKSCFRFVIRPILNEETGESNVLMVIADNTVNALARIEKEKVYEMLNFALNASELGVAEYSLVGQKGFATKAWYRNMGVEEELDDFTNAHHCLLPEFRTKVDACLDKIRAGQRNPFLETVQVQLPSGEKHWIHYLIQLMEYKPEKGIVVVAELTYNIDDQVIREEELLNALKNVRQADRLKNSFIANMREEIRVPLQEIIHDSLSLTKEGDPEEKLILSERIERNNQVLLTLLDRLIDVAKKNKE